jgi:hypothetical protein
MGSDRRLSAVTSADAWIDAHVAEGLIALVAKTDA